MSGGALATAGMLVLAVAAISLTVTKAKVSRPMREWATGRNRWLGELVSCPYCFSHWLSFAAVAVYRQPLANSGFLVLDLFVTAMAIVAVSAMAVGLIALALSFVPE